tara:strand:+ start:5216 stop:5713 length:498 start_codon:yes stop_codon:yes gene_type:complete
MPKKHLNKDKKKRAVKRQGCCGLFACLYALGIKVKTAEDIEKYRRMCLEKKLVLCPHGKRWLGGTTRWDRTRILNHFGAKVEPVSFQARTLGRVLKEKQIYQTKGDYLVTVTKHVLFLRTNMSKTKLFLMDQRGVRMQLGSDALKRNCGQRVKDIVRVSVPVAAV